MSIRHPCFDRNYAATATRIHLPVAKSCNIQCRFCNRLYDCVNETRPGVTSAILKPWQAAAYLERMVGIIGPIDVTGIAGPGDAFSDPDNTVETLRLVHEKFPSMALCVSTNGFMAAEYAEILAKTGVTHVSVTVNAVDPEIGAKVISWVRFEKKMYRGIEAAKLLIRRQLEAIAAFKTAGLTIKVNTIVIPTVNENHIEEIARSAAQAGANVHNCMPFMPVAGSEFEHDAAPDHDTMQKARWIASSFMPQVRHCNRCRADAAGLLGKDEPAAQDLIRYFAAQPIKPFDNRPLIAVASREGVLVNEHLGRAEQFFIFRRADDGSIEQCEVRPAPKQRGDRWRNLARALSDCRAIIASQAGEPPKAVLEDEGISVITTEGLIQEAVALVYEGRQVRLPVNLQPCTGPANGQGCA